MNDPYAAQLVGRMLSGSLGGQSRVAAPISPIRRPRPRRPQRGPLTPIEYLGTTGVFVPGGSTSLTYDPAIPIVQPYTLLIVELAHNSNAGGSHADYSLIADEWRPVTGLASGVGIRLHEAPITPTFQPSGITITLNQTSDIIVFRIGSPRDAALGNGVLTDDLTLPALPSFTIPGTPAGRSDDYQFAAVWGSGGDADAYANEPTGDPGDEPWSQVHEHIAFGGFHKAIFIRPTHGAATADSTVSGATPAQGIATWLAPLG